MSHRPRLVHRPRITGPGAAEAEEFNTNGALSPATVRPVSPEEQASGRIDPYAPGGRHTLREVQMENVHPLRLRLLLEIEQILLRHRTRRAVATP